ncbi:MAG TPA: protein-disulfide reductase DsbD domain-containing protein, partial [Magnetospirillum sp.]|nr:protein-disulfide reductase DsbD domain-containing protein [Magnetospirillum sp.]
MVVALAGLLALLAGNGWAAEPGASDWSTNDAGQVRLISATTTAGEGAPLRLGLQFQLQPGWKIYWRTPGDAGYPPKVDWNGSDNIGAPVLSWPAPKRFQLAGLQNHGYGGEVVLPVEAPVLKAGQPAHLVANLDFLTCAQICVPQQAKLELDLPPGPAQPSAFVHDIGRFASLVPGDGARHGLTLESVEAVGEGDDARLRVTVNGAEPFDHLDMFIEPAELASFDAPTVTLS